MRKVDRRRMGTFEHWCRRCILRIPWVEKRTNPSIDDQVGVCITLEEMMAKQKLKFFGHIMRGTGLEKSVMVGMGGGSRSGGVRGQDG